MDSQDPTSNGFWKSWNLLVYISSWMVLKIKQHIPKQSSLISTKRTLKNHFCLLDNARGRSWSQEVTSLDGIRFFSLMDLNIHSLRWRKSWRIRFHIGLGQLRNFMNSLRNENVYCIFWEFDFNYSFNLLWWRINC